MSDAMYAGGGGPRCPNHRVPLVDCKDGVGICPISSCEFSYDADEWEKTKKHKINALGGIDVVGDWKVKQIHGEGG